MWVIQNHQVTSFATNHTSGHILLRPPLEERAGYAPDEVLYDQLSAVFQRLVDDYLGIGQYAGFSANDQIRKAPEMRDAIVAVAQDLIEVLTALDDEETATTS